MTHSDLQRNFGSVNVVTTTPFSEDGQSVRYDALRDNVSFLCEAGIRLLIPCGGTSEYASLTNDERVNVVAATVEAAAEDASVVAGVGGPLEQSLELVAEYEAAGADGVMIHPADHPGRSDSGLVEYYRTIAEETELGVMLYKSDPAATDDMIAELAGIDNVLAIKYSDGVNDLAETLSTLPENVVDDLVWVNGRAELNAVTFGVEGAVGFTTGIGNFVPEVCLDLVDALEAGDWERARRIREVVRPYQELRGEPGPGNSIAGANSLAAVKYGQELAGLYGGPARTPARAELGDGDKERAEEYYDRIQNSSY